jgi:hypothetical protein
VILLGAEMNAEIEHASPYGKDPGEKIPGQRRKIGPAAMRAWLARRRAGGEKKQPTAEEVKEAAATGVAEGAAIARTATIVHNAPQRIPLSRQLPRGRRFSDWVIGTAALAAQVWWAARAVRHRLRTSRRVRL